MGHSVDHFVAILIVVSPLQSAVCYSIQAIHVAFYNMLQNWYCGRHVAEFALRY